MDSQVSEEPTVPATVEDLVRAIHDRVDQEASLGGFDDFSAKYIEGMRDLESFVDDWVERARQGNG